MNIGIIGSGMIGSTAARLFVKAGHHVAVSNSRGPDTLKKLVSELGPLSQALTAEDAARFGDVVLVAIPLVKFTSLPIDALAGKTVIDANNYYPERDGRFPELDSDATTSSEMLAAHLPKSHIVKAFNTIYFEHLAQQGQSSLPTDARRAIFVAGDDRDAKTTVIALIEEIGFGAVDTGTLRDGGRRQQPGTAVYNQEMTVAQGREVLMPGT